LQHNEIKVSFDNSFHIVGRTFNVNLYRRLQEFVYKYDLMHTFEVLDRVRHVDINSYHCGCVLRHAHNLPYACELARYDHRTYP